MALAVPQALAMPTSDPANNLNSTSAAADRLVNAREDIKWPENGLLRRRTVFLAVGIDPSTYCHYWTDTISDKCYFLSNVQCGWDDHDQGGTWHVDASYVMGPGGGYPYYHCLEKTRIAWQNEFGCRTG
ncbi:hypothetical protein OQA88_9229 [Cercophora sp. LCS_1]